MDAAQQRETTPNRPACTECQRRKQKCNREWPCDHCHKRNIASQCRYKVSSPPRLEQDAGARLDVSNVGHQESSDGIADEDDGDFDLSVEALATHLHTSLGIGFHRRIPTQKLDWVDAESSVQLQRVLQLLPRRRYMDELVEIFIHDVNYHYYVIYPPVFLSDYQAWWDNRSRNQPITLQWTCLLAIICACSLQHLDNDFQDSFEPENPMTTAELSEELHSACRELAGSIPPGHYHFLNVQRLLHSCYWYKSEARFPEAWHVLNTAILEAKELAFHRNPAPGVVSEFDLEMRRRIWCILDTWDWQISSGLGRPLLIDRTDCDAQLPLLTLEGYELSPLLHMKLQAQLVRSLTYKFGSPKDVVTPLQIFDYTVEVEAWEQSFPPQYRYENPDTSLDQIYPWTFSHRYYVYIMACLLILNPIRPFMVKRYTQDTPADDLRVRTIGMDWSFRTMKALRHWVNSIDRRDGRLHFVIFSIFDTAAILCTAAMKNHDSPMTSKQEKQDVLDAVTDAVDMLKLLNKISTTAKASYTILCQLVRRLPKPASQRLPGTEMRSKRAKFAKPRQPDAAARAQQPPLPIVPIATPAIIPVSCAVEYSNSPVATAAPQNNYIGVGMGHEAGPAISNPVYITSPSVATVHGQVLQNHLFPSASSNVMYLPGPPGPPGPPALPSHMHALAPGMPVPSYAHTGGFQFPPAPAMMQNPPVPGIPMPSASYNIQRATPYTFAHYVPQAEDPGPDINLQTLTQADLGELGAMWQWHSGNLDLQNGENPGYQPQM